MQYRVYQRSLRIGIEIHTQNGGTYFQKSDSNHYFGVDSTINLEWIQLQNDVIPNMTPKRVDSTALHYESTEKTSHPSGGSRGGWGGGAPL